MMAALPLTAAASAFVNEWPSAVMGTASDALGTLATTGNPDPLQAELGGTVMSSEDLQMKVGHLLNLEKDEHLAPKALVTPTGETYAMVAPTITKDIFILGDNTGQARRMDVGDSELSDLYPTQFLGQVRIGLQNVPCSGIPSWGAPTRFGLPRILWTHHKVWCVNLLRFRGHPTCFFT